MPMLNVPWKMDDGQRGRLPRGCDGREGCLSEGDRQATARHCCRRSSRTLVLARIPLLLRHPPPPPDATVYIPPGPPQKTETPLLAPVLDWAVEKVVPSRVGCREASDLADDAWCSAELWRANLPVVGPRYRRHTLTSPRKHWLRAGTGLNMALGIEPFYGLNWRSRP